MTKSASVRRQASEKKREFEWADLSLPGLCMVALSGVTMRSKIVFSLPFINYNHLLEAHSHFTFGGWVTLGLLSLLLQEVLPAPFNGRPVYRWLLGILLVSAWGMFFAFLFMGYGVLSIVFSILFILATYVFGGLFIRDMLKAKVGMPASPLAVSSLVSLIVSSSGTLVLLYIFLRGSFDAILYRDALFTYLHFQYNGFFTLAVLSLLFNRREPVADTANTKRFAFVLCASILPSLFLSYLWQNPDRLIRAIAIGGSALVLLACLSFLFCIPWIRAAYRKESAPVRWLLFLSISSFFIKSFLQIFTIFPEVGNAIFGNRPIIMGFLHLVFLGFVSLFILASYVRRGLLDGSDKFTRSALVVFTVAVLVNEGLLITQGLATWFIPGNILFPWLLWAAGLGLFAGSVLIGISRIISYRRS